MLLGMKVERCRDCMGWVPGLTLKLAAQMRTVLNFYSKTVGMNL